MHGVPAFRAFGAPGRGTPLPYPPAYARIAGLGPIPRPPRAGPRVRPGPSAIRRAARLPLCEGAEPSDQGSGALHALQLRRRRQQAASSERRAARQIEFARQFPKPEVFRLAAVPGIQGTPGSTPEPYPPGARRAHPRARRVALEWVRRRGWGSRTRSASNSRHPHRESGTPAGQRMQSIGARDARDVQATHICNLIEISGVRVITSLHFCCAGWALTRGRELSGERPRTLI